MTTTISTLDPAIQGTPTPISPIVTLDHDLVWIDEFAWSGMEGVATPTIGGGEVVQEIAISDEIGRPVTLQSQNGQGWQRKSTVEALIAAALVVDRRFYLQISHNSLTLAKTVRLRHEQQGGAIQFSMISPMDGLQTSTSWYAGTIYFSIIDW